MLVNGEKKPPKIKQISTHSETKTDENIENLNISGVEM